MSVSSETQDFSEKVWTDSFVDVNLHFYHCLYFSDYIKNIELAVKTGETYYFWNHEGIIEMQCRMIVKTLH